ncbi:hypothetical protein HPP92_023941 [Vanilla planifolia]|uniref:Uncharacterized protein n=1 Tax=Vanilla planifolia TaxID=51239 RepID=A0A835PRU3_VANPL|nr:hypothetical protein HPP92_023941 [Vanilla planifolia]
MSPLEEKKFEGHMGCMADSSSFSIVLISSLESVVTSPMALPFFRPPGRRQHRRVRRYPRCRWRRILLKRMLFVFLFSS